MEMDALGVKGSVPGRRRRWCGGVGSAAQKKYNDYRRWPLGGASFCVLYRIISKRRCARGHACQVNFKYTLTLISGIEKFLENKLKELTAYSGLPNNSFGNINIWGYLVLRNSLIRIETIINFPLFGTVKLLFQAKRLLIFGLAKLSIIWSETFADMTTRCEQMSEYAAAGTLV